MSDVQNSFADIPVSFLSDDAVINDLLYSFIIALLFYVVLCGIASLNVSFWDYVAISRMCTFIRYAIVIEDICLFILLYYTLTLGSPIGEISSVWIITARTSWIFSSIRPVAGLILISFGFVSGMHGGARMICAFGCILQMISDAVSIVATNSYYLQVSNQKIAAPKTQYSLGQMQFYMYRDIVSFSLSVLILLISIHLIVALGLGTNNRYPYYILSGGDNDRCEIMRKQVRLRKSGKEDIESTKINIS